MSPRNQAGFTWIELLVGLGVVAVLVVVALPYCERALIKGGGMGSSMLGNMKQLHHATQQMALDGDTMKDTNLGWPGDTGGTFSNWTAQLVGRGYLTTNDLCKLLSGPGIVVPLNKIPPSMSNTAVLVYAVRNSSEEGDTVFLSTANFTNTPTGGILNPEANPYGNKGFLVLRMNGSGAILQAKQAGQTNLIGSFSPLCR